MTRIATVQGGLAISDPIAVSVARVYKLPPPETHKYNSFPCFVNSVRLLPLVYASSLLRRTYEVRMQLLVKDNDFGRGCEIALAFEEELIRAFASDITLENHCTNIETIVGELANLNGYPGLDYRLLLHMAEAQTMGG